ncbi:MAG: hypothetical protein ACI4V7_10290 [Succinivibrionaceae bacterium]
MPTEIKEVSQKLMPWNEEIQEKYSNFEEKQKKTEPILLELKKSEHFCMIYVAK